MLMRIVTILLLIAAVTALPAVASVCATDVVPAASLLFPYVVLDYAHPFGGTTTILTITNLSHEAQIVTLTLWTNFDIPLLSFNMILTGYDQQQVNLRDVLFRGQLPVTVQDRHRDHDGARDSGPVSTRSSTWLGVMKLAAPEPTDLLGGRCSDDLPAYPGRYTSRIQDTLLDLFRAWFGSSRDLGVLVSQDCGDPLLNPAPATPPRWYSDQADDAPITLYATSSPDRFQTWMATIHSAWGTQADFVPATVMGNANCWADQVMPNLGVDYHYISAD